MNLLEKRRSRQAQRTAERHYFKFIASYVKSAHKEIYDEAQTMYTHAKAENPGVKDLTKTAYYIRRVHPDAAVPRYYINRKLKSSTPTQECRRMVLNIQLMSPQTRGSLLPATATLPLLEAESTSQPPEAESTPLPPEAESTPLPESTSQQPEAESTPLPESTSQPPEAESTPLLLPLETYQSLLADLQKDPELERILNNFPFDHNMDGGEDSMDPFVVNDMLWPDEFTPLEVDVQTTFDNLT